MAIKLNNERQISLGVLDLNWNDNLLLPIERKEDLCLIIISDFLLSDRKVLQKFDNLLQGIKDNLYPLAFVLMGPFFSISTIDSEEEFQEIR